MAYEPFCQPLFVLLLLFSHYVVSDSSETIRTVACQAPLSMGRLSQEYYNGLPCLSPGHFPNPGTESTSPTWQVDSLPLSHLGSLSTLENSLISWDRIKAECG